MSSVEEHQATSLEAGGSNPPSRSALVRAIREADPVEVKEFWAAAKRRIEKMPKGEAKWERGFTSQAGIYEFWGSRFWISYEELAEPYGIPMPRSIHVARFTQGRSHDAWGKYITFHLAYTLPDFRQEGHGLQLLRKVEAVAIAEGMDRIRSTVQSWGGMRLHLAAGHRFWGRNEKNELVVDSALFGAQVSFPNGIPKRARKFSTYELTTDELIEHAVSAYGISGEEASLAVRRYRS